MFNRNGRQITIAVTCIGSGVAQSIVNSLRSSSLNTRIVGMGNNMFAFGLYDCDMHDYLPSIYSSDYRGRLLEKCQQYGVQVLLPGLDDDASFLSQQTEWFRERGVEVLVSGPDLVAACRDKVKICNLLHDVTDSFVESFTRKNFPEALDSGKLRYPFIAKPL
ncbi:MAG: hypothetical protein ACOC2L_02730, partial [Candidatus Sumerlaeota bacterium]